MDQPVSNVPSSLAMFNLSFFPVHAQEKVDHTCVSPEGARDLLCFAVEVVRDPKTLTSRVVVGDRTGTTKEGLLSFRDGQRSGYDGSRQAVEPSALSS